LSVSRPGCVRPCNFAPEAAGIVGPTLPRTPHPIPTSLTIAMRP
jgi:hypothetical protein